MAKKVLLIGIDLELIDFSRSNTGLDAGKVRAAGREAVEKLKAIGYEASECLVDLGETAAPKFWMRSQKTRSIALWLGQEFA